MACPEVAGETCLLTGRCAGTPATGWCPISTVRTMRLRWLLPLCNLAIDVFLFAVVVHAVDAERGNMRHPPPLWHQVQGYVDRGFCKKGIFQNHSLRSFAGTAPAAIVAGLPLPNGWRASSPFDIRWASLYLVLATSLWYGLGRWAETRDNPKLKRFAEIYILLRVS